ncbi:M67 family metallopeptidase [Limnospira fusiformis KN01]|uniref:Mov34/MPN/PAD-1 family protein n=1 Tax=Limnospira maxima CS-328 TaxID=513049 RepID=B5VYN1_LIMMA|nr:MULTISPECIES: M67 family metallopeptidase [Limnospira]EKD06975.1 Mov34/MPN/PAD-1 family protein [Arthrospira platensis C1]MDC0839486.1 M67 family metallopeptidase [Limnoraphis robusta]QJB26223.1 M67 family metallopeptidase [Limnospira fusiformis SAG 85.79]EDZ95651.1 Mov34/MPN/PAD-1 family protein [Limnospira maxima CS-328]MDT9188442.1 M67 family metallopeptidase [Limnospira sp. PMC 894.15]
MLIITSEQVAKIRNHAEQSYPQECCGLLMGRQDSGDRKMIMEVWSMENAWSPVTAEVFQGLDNSPNITTRQERFTIAPEALMKAQKEGRDRHLSIIGIYHSHPDHTAIPSEFDRVCAWSEYSYIIVSVIGGQATDLLNWCLDTNHQFQAEELIYRD